MKPISCPGITKPQDSLSDKPVIQEIECTVLYQNINGWSRKKQDNATVILDKKGVDTFAVVEHKKRRKQDLPNFMGYDRWAKSRENENGGGVCMG